MFESFPKTRLEFETAFTAEEDCLDYLAKLRWPEGFVCPKCARNLSVETRVYNPKQRLRSPPKASTLARSSPPSGSPTTPPGLGANPHIRPSRRNFFRKAL